MFLAALKKEQKRAFLGLAQKLIAADGTLCQSEITTMKQYRVEMNLRTAREEREYDMEQALEVFKNTTTTVKKQIMFELVALACVDKDFSDPENTLIEKILSCLDLDGAFLENCKANVKELIELYEKIGKLVR